MKKSYIYHRQLVEDNRLSVERIACVARELRAIVLVPLDLEQSMDGLGGSARDLAHALCGASRRCGERDLEPVILKQLKDPVQGRCFSRSGAARQDKQTALNGGDYCLSLEIAVFYAVLFSILSISLSAAFLPAGGNRSICFMRSAEDFSAL